MPGVRNPDRPGHWLVPPWPDDASFTDVVAHFLSRNPPLDSPTTILLAYFEGYQAALEAAPPDRSADEFGRHWCAGMQTDIVRCVTVYREQRAREMRRKSREMAS